MKRQDLRVQHRPSITAQAGTNQLRTTAASMQLGQRSRSVALCTG